ncbi:hypothetical protein SAMN05660493_02033 [Epilithonimonas bovis DSM 19482]|uniref:Uncharacterized protein n=1 Tax=Epilithonimonas bovis DSM 19482 TaxID=1121284 RepID=A0A1U7PX97_9FLAO|nr:hypothetical protein [Epilithonimonas bovis]QIY82271.1 hypothetical protein HER18_01270 [Chryseobacterium sp. NEB161]SIT97317.1 hypothetical protein SAMN05660493_02033 [Epilithonimonas bovis DSM 19482]
MKKLDVLQMENLQGGINVHFGCACLGLAAGIASGMNPIVGGLTTLGCLETVSHQD